MFLHFSKNHGKSRRLIGLGCEIDRIVQVNNWIRLTWWQKTRAAALLFSGVGVLGLFALAILLAGLSQTSAMSGLSWFAFSMFPLLVVVLIATLVRVQSRINLRSGGVRVSQSDQGDGKK